MEDGRSRELPVYVSTAVARSTLFQRHFFGAFIGIVVARFSVPSENRL